MLTAIKHKIHFIIKRYLYYFGYIIEQIPDANYLTQVHEEVRRYKLRKLANNIKKLDDHKLYNRILKKYAVEWKDDITSAEFVGNGFGGDNVEVYRKVLFQNIYYFEKVYFNGSYDLLRIEWFYEYIYTNLKKYLNPPKLFKVIKGDLITIVYFEYLDLVTLPREEWHSVFYNISKNMYMLFKDVNKLLEAAPNCVKDYRLHSYYTMTIKEAEKNIKKLSNNRLTVQMIEEVINLQPLILSHGDIHERNVFANNYIIDWDSFGFFPHGFEVAIIYANNIKSITFESLQEILIEEYNEVVPTYHWEGFVLSCWYFYLIFTSREDITSETMSLQKDVFNVIEKLYYKLRIQYKFTEIIINN